ncbi:Uncharacterized conserved protein, DUF305 family [Parafrankia irregularis]|uniref:Uncharacterized conserved protein, DUF305 family n=2 Tax=Frankiaceae TaxID=74712 RepID=A0A0S4QSF0_9ACTN|nr:DUF305 domain-containing protein [Parafrankia sp. CH37]CUU58544.1 Uncharacterized conserved protein, DUF305 family [Parafrankia irregularis]
MPPASNTTDGVTEGSEVTDAEGPAADLPADPAAGTATGSAVADYRAPVWVRLWWTPLVLFAVVGLLAAGAGIRALIDRPPADSSVDVGFARDMSEHHSQAVQMAMVEFSHGGDAAIRSVAQDIALGQQREIGIMATWLSGWGRTETSAREPMAWMAGDSGATGDGRHSAHEGMGMGAGAEADAGSADTSVRMPGMASEAELARLAGASGRDLDIQFLTLMIRHHRGGIAMAQYAWLHADSDKVRTLARVMVGNQDREITQMQADLERLGAPRA